MLENFEFKNKCLMIKYDVMVQKIFTENESAKFPTNISETVLVSQIVARKETLIK